MILKKIAGYLLIPLSCLLIVSCGGGGDGDKKEDPASGSNWDQMEWDKGSWS